MYNQAAMSVLRRAWRIPGQLAGARVSHRRDSGLPDRSVSRSAALGVRAYAVDPADKKGPSDEQKAKLLEAAVKSINTRYGQGTIMDLRGGELDNRGLTSTGCAPLDAILGGGLPKGRVVEIFGPESTGKSTLVLHALAEVMKAGGYVCLVDAEYAFDAEYAESIGIDVSSGRFQYVQPTSGEEALQIVDDLVRTNVLDMIAVDSVAALVPAAELEGDIGAVQVAPQARLMSSSLRKLSGNISKTNTALLFTNQIRYKMSPYGNPETTPGGNALKYYASIRVDLRKREVVKGKNNEPIGIRVKAKVVKNKVAPPSKECEFDILFKGGIDQEACFLDTLILNDIVVRRGAYYFLAANKRTGAPEENIGQGKEGVIKKFKEEPDFKAELERELKIVLGQADPGEANDATASAATKTNSVEPSAPKGKGKRMRKDDE